MTIIQFGKQKDRSKADFAIVSEAGANANVNVGDQEDDSQRTVAVFDLASLKDIDALALARELRLLAVELRGKAVNTNDRRAAESVEAAAAAAEHRDPRRTSGFLRQAGKWALDVAAKIGTPVATAALKAVLGL